MTNDQGRQWYDSTYSIDETQRRSSLEEGDLLRLLGTRRLLPAEREDTESDSDSEPELEPDSESELPDIESDSEPELESESDEELEDDRRLLLLGLLSSLLFPFPLSFSLSFSLSSSILLAIPVFVLNSSGISTDGAPLAFSFASDFGFSSISVREGRET
jgi:hypothetical protein